MSRKCDHDWFDHYMMYTALSNGSGDWGWKYKRGIIATA